MPFSRSRKKIVKNANKIEFYSPILVSNPEFLFKFATPTQSFEENIRVDILGNVFATRLIKEGDILLKFNDKVENLESGENLKISSIKMFYNFFNLAQNTFNKYKKKNDGRNEEIIENFRIIQREKKFPILLLENNNGPLSLKVALSRKKIESGEKIFEIDSVFEEIDQYSFASTGSSFDNILKIYAV